MGTTFDVLNASQSLIARRQAASSLPAFELPPPPPALSQFAMNVAQKYTSFPTSNPPPQVTSTVGVGNLLTPLSNNNSDSASPSATVTSSGGNHTQNNQSNPGILPYAPSYWPPSTTGPTMYNTGFAQPWQGSNALFGTRAMFSPSLGSLVRNSNNSPATGEGQSLPPPPPFDMNILPPFHSSMSMSAPPNSTDSLQQMHQQPPQPAQSLSTSIMASQNGMPSASQSPAVHSSETGGPKPASTANLYESSQSSSTSQRPDFQYAARTPIQQSPHPSAAPSTHRVSPQIGQTPTNSAPSQGHFVRPPYSPYSLPAMQGSVMANAHNPGGSMPMVGNMQHGMMQQQQLGNGYSADTQNMYASQQQQQQHHHHHHHHQSVPNDRPFKCDQCPQSFNRNHDLKRHRRIHLAVKPFPCNHCDKSFSRKDALKRHILVKGCGKRGQESCSKEESTPIPKELRREAANDTSVVSKPA